MRGTGRVANLLADLEFVVSSDGHENDRPFVSHGAGQLRELVLDTETLQKFVMMKRIVEELGIGSVASDSVKKGTRQDPGDPWSRWKQLFQLYEVMTVPELATKDMGFLQDLKGDLAYLAIMRGWMFVYDVDAAVRPDGRDEGMSVADAAAHCVHVLRRRMGPARVWIRMWRSLEKVPKDAEERDLNDVQRIHRGVKFIRRHIEDLFRHDEVLLLVQWDRLRMLQDLLETARENGLQLGRELLDDALHSALVLGRCVAAELLFDGGAETTLYHYISANDIEGKRSNEIVGADGLAGKTTVAKPRQPWAELLKSIASDRTRAPYLCRLIADKKFTEDSEAKLILKQIYSDVLQLEYDDERTSTDFCLFMLMLLANRQDMAQLFWRREGQERPASSLHTAILACVLSRNLSRGMERGTALDSLLQTAAWFEGAAVRILTRVNHESVELALQWIVDSNRAINFAKRVAVIDLVVMGRCEELIQECSDLCIDAVQIKFSGNDTMFRSADRCIVWLFGLLPGPSRQSLTDRKSEMYR
jgi:hypothetical protein